MNFNFQIIKIEINSYIHGSAAPTYHQFTYLLIRQRAHVELRGGNFTSGQVCNAGKTDLQFRSHYDQIKRK